MSVVYDAGALIAADRGERRIWADHEALMKRGFVPWTTAPVVAQVSRSPDQARLRRFLRGCRVAAFDPSEAHTVGALLGGASAADVVDAHVVITAAARAATVVTSDPRDLRRLAKQLSSPVPVQSV